jgi:hypothetical protein
MIITVRLTTDELKEIEKIIQREGLDLHEFIRYAIKNQIELEKEGVSKLNNLLLKINKVDTEEKKVSMPMYSRLKLVNHGNFVLLDNSTIRERAKYPIWAIKNKYFPVKFVLRVLQNLAKDFNGGLVPIQTFKSDIKELSILIRDELEKLDRLYDNKRGERFSTGFPKDGKESFERFFSNFVVSFSADNKLISGLPYEIGFLDVKQGNLILTKEGYEFTSIPSPIFDKYLVTGENPEYHFSNEEIKYLLNHIKLKVPSEAELFRFIVTKITEGLNTPDHMNSSLKLFLEERFPKEKGYTDKSVASLRAGITSRMVELKVIKLDKKGSRSYYALGEFAEMFRN